MKDTVNLTKFLLILTQIYPQSAIRYFNSKNDWVKTNRQEESVDPHIDEHKNKKNLPFGLGFFFCIFVEI